MKLTLVILLLLGTTIQMAKSQYSNGYSIDISETLSKGYQSAMNTMKNGYQWVRDHFSSTSGAVENYASTAKQAASNAAEHPIDTIEDGYYSAKSKAYDTKAKYTG